MESRRRSKGHEKGGPGPVRGKPSASPNAPFTWEVRVYYEDTDLGGVVYHANYLRYMERTRTEWLRALGFEQDVLRQKFHAQFVIVEAHLTFHRPARFNDLLDITAEVKDIGKASLTFIQTIHIAGQNHAKICSGEVRAACVDPQTFKPRSLPRDILMEIAG